MAHGIILPETRSEITGVATLLPPARTPFLYQTQSTGMIVNSHARRTVARRNKMETCLN